jgi:hypothetical protein
MNDLKIIGREKPLFSFDINLFSKELCEKYNLQDSLLSGGRVPLGKL